MQLREMDLQDIKSVFIFSMKRDLNHLNTETSKATKQQSNDV